MNMNNKENNTLKSVNLAAIGNYTKNAVENFEKNIVEETNYLEKVDNKLKNNSK